MRINTLICVLIVCSIGMWGQTTFKNPILRGMNPDPSICRVGDDFYLVTSTFEYFPGLPIYKSKDLVHWKMIGYVLSRASNNPLMGAGSGTGGQYAPTLRYHDSTFYVACTNYGGNGSQGQFYVTAKNPEGPWSDPIWVSNWYVDPSMSFENDTMYYLTPNNDDGFLLGVMNPKTGKYYKPLQKIAKGTGGSSPEGPHMYKINNYYYLMNAEGGTGFEHKEVIQRSTSPWGPYETSPINPIISHKNAPKNPFQAIGHADLVQLKDSSWWLVCLGIRPKGGNYHHLGRETFLAPVTWNAEGWPKVGTDGIVKEEYTVPNLPEYIWEKEPVRDDFDSSNLRLTWNFIRNPHDADWSLTEKSGFLRLKGSKISFKEKDSPAFVGRRQSAFNMVASAKVDFNPVKANEEAGLVVRGDDYNHFDLLLTRLGSKKVVMFRKYLVDKVQSIKYQEVADSGVILRVSATDLQYKFWFQEPGKTAVLLASANTKDISTEVIGGFTGTYIGMYASGNGSANTNPADFDWFDYEEEPTTPYDWATGPQDSTNHMLAPEIVSITSNRYDSAKIVWKNTLHANTYFIERFTGTRFDSIGATNDTIFFDKGLEGNTMYFYRIIAKNDSGYSRPSIAVSVITMPKPGPFLGTPAQIPGKIEAENYDFGKKGEAFYDTDATNNGGKYRNDAVDIENCWDTGNGYDIGFINNGEWLLYTVNVADSLCDVQFRVACTGDASVKILFDGEETATINIPSTGGWSNWQTISLKNVKLPLGENQKLKVLFGGGLNFNWMNFVKSPRTSLTISESNSIKVFPNPAKNIFQVENPQSFSKIELFSLTGSLLKTFIPEKESTMDISDLPKGIYMGKLISKTQAIHFFKLVKE